MAKSAKQHTATRNVFQTTEALAAAIAAFETAGKKVVRYGEKSIFPESAGSKEMIQDFLTGGQALQVTDDHRERAREVSNWLTQKLTMNLLSNSSNSGFFVDICKLVSDEIIQYRNIGLLSWAPKLYTDMLAREEREHDIRESCSTSHFVGQLGKPIEISISVKERQYMRDFGKFRVIAVDNNNNLLQFYITNIEVDIVTIKARVKNHTYSNQYRGLPITQLNYVKII